MAKILNPKHGIYVKFDLTPPGWSAFDRERTVNVISFLIHNQPVEEVRATRRSLVVYIIPPPDVTIGYLSQLQDRLRSQIVELPCVELSWVSNSAPPWANNSSSEK